METQVHVTFSALNGDIEPSERILSLRPDRPRIHIGRASKSVNKGLEGAVDNAWFDSPVMSRNHAELSLGLEDNEITIVDIGSMHGTFLNTTALKQYEPTILKDNDVVVFGARVTRGTETIPPCAFRITCEYSPYKNKSETLTFACPDSSDVDEDYDVSDNDALDRSSSGDGLSVASPQAKPTPYVNAIDLTDDDECVPSSQINVDIAASQSSATNDSEEIVLGRISASDNDNVPVPSAIVLDSDDEDEHATSNIEYQQWAESDSDDAGSMDEDPIVAEGQNFKAEGQNIEAKGQNIEAEGQNIEAEGQKIEAEGRLSQRASEMGIPNLAEALLREPLAPSEFPLFDEQESEEDPSDCECDHESDLGLSDAEQEGLRAYYDLTGGRNASPRYQARSEDKTIPESSTLAEANLTIVINDEIVVEASNTSSVDYGTQDPVDPPSSSLRQPSPSDAAMVKPAVAKTLTPIPEHNRPRNEFNYFTTRTLTRPIVRADQEIGGCHDNPFPISNWPLEIFPTVTGRYSSPVLDTKSAMQYNKSKALMTGAIMDASPQFNRSKLTIDDIIDNSTTPEPETHKRKADHISDLTESELRAWASTSALDSIKESLDVPAVSGSPAQTATPAGTAAAQSSTSSSAATTQEPENEAPAPERSMKRLKKVVEGAAFIALGGVGLFSLLVATAPDFV